MKNKKAKVESKKTHQGRKLTKKKKQLIIVTTIVIALLLVVVAFLRPSKKQEKVNYEKTSGITTLLTIDDPVEDNSIWCGTFQLIWNDLKNNLAKQEIIFYPQIDAAGRLNQELFTEKDINRGDYYKVLGHPTYDLKNQIEEEIKNKFNETSDILKEFEWDNNNIKDYFLYAMLKKDFRFPKEFLKLDDSNFKEYENIKYFGVNSSNLEELKDQIEVIYYESQKDFAIKLKTKKNDEIIINKNPEGDTLLNIYQKIIEKGKKFNGEKALQQGELLKIPNINIKEKTEFESIENRPFVFENGREYTISKAIQTINFELNSKGGKIKSETGMDIKWESSADIETQRNFSVDDTFAIFLIEQEKEMPYFGGKITDIRKFQ